MFSQLFMRFTLNVNEANKGKINKGETKIEMKIIEDYASRMIAFSKPKAGIHKKMSELITLHDVKAAFLVFSEGGNPYTFAHPSIEELAELLNNPSRQQPPNKDNTLLIVETHKKQMIDELVKTFQALKEELATVDEKLKLLKKSRNEKKLEKMWWNTPLEDLSVEKCQPRHQAFVELYDNLCDMALSQMSKTGGASSSGREGRGHTDGG